MGQSAFDWKSFWDIATPEEAAHTLAEWYGAEATWLAATCALAACGDDRDEDYRFWYAVFAKLRVQELRPVAAAPALLPDRSVRRTGMVCDRDEGFSSWALTTPQPRRRRGWRGAPVTRARGRIDKEAEATSDIERRRVHLVHDDGGAADIAGDSTPRCTAERTPA